MYTDADWAHEKVDRKSVGGWLLTINNKPVTWQANKQSVVAQSSAESEFMALVEGIKEVVFLIQWFKLYCNIDINIKVNTDNTGALEMSDHATNHKRTKHMDIKWFYVRDIIKQYKILVKWIPTKDQLADILTKSVKTNIFKDLLSKLYVAA
ncbi:MAG: Ty1/Copia family ribonuclease HI [Nitrososphaeraceae archaeon]